jgi:hypothetical protein
MNGVVFHTSEMMIAHLAGHSEPVQRICVLNSLLTMPSKANTNTNSFAVTAVGIAQGTSTAARITLRPRKARPMMMAIQKPRTVSRTTVTMVKKNVVPIALQNCEPRVPGGQAWPLQLWASQWT